MNSTATATKTAGDGGVALVDIPRALASEGKGEILMKMVDHAEELRTLASSGRAAIRDVEDGQVVKIALLAAVIGLVEDVAEKIVCTVGEMV